MWSVIHQVYNWLGSNPRAKGYPVASESRNLVRKDTGRRRAPDSRLPPGSIELDEVAVAPEVAYRRIWIEIQRRHPEPVNAIGLRIDPRDQMELKRWRDAGIDHHLRKS
jgi:hypothetical protein